MNSLFVKAALLLVGAAFVSAQTYPNLVTNLPGQPAGVNFQQYAGYVNVNQTHGRKLFYWFFESQNDPATDPVVLWLNGGPGCSSLGGAFGELGPFMPNVDGVTLQLNPYSWNKVANVVFLESPSGVGFSYSTTTADYTTGDVQTTDDSLNFLVQFFKMYPRFATNDFFVGAESYGGHYCPKLAQAIVNSNKAALTTIPLKGFLVGNAWTDAALDNQGAAFYWWTHAVNSKETYDGIMSTCNFTNIGPLAFKGEKAVDSTLDPVACNLFLAKSTAELGDHTNIYDIYTDVCLKRDTNGRALMRHLAAAGSPFGAHMHALSEGPLSLDPCIDDHVQTYLNQESVRQAIHVEVSYQWVDCSPRVNYNYQDLLSSMLPVYEDLFAANLRILIYSGDVDAIVPVTGTRAWIAALNRPVVEAWRPWLASNEQTGGWVTKYDQFEFATVREAGHMVPLYQPSRAFTMFSRFISGKPL